MEGGDGVGAQLGLELVPSVVWVCTEGKKKMTGGPRLPARGERARWKGDAPTGGPHLSVRGGGCALRLVGRKRELGRVGCCVPKGEEGTREEKKKWNGPKTEEKKKGRKKGFFQNSLGV